MYILVPYDKILFGIDKLRNLINEVEMTVIAHQRLNKKMYAPHQLYILNYTKEVYIYIYILSHCDQARRFRDIKWSSVTDHSRISQDTSCCLQLFMHLGQVVLGGDA